VRRHLTIQRGLPVRPRDDINAALSGLDEGIKKLGPLVTLQLMPIDLELRRHNYDGALNRLALIAAQSERKETWLVRRGEILKLAGKEEEARAAFNDALVAIESLPPERRQSKAVTALELRAHSAEPCIGGLLRKRRYPRCF
jgi:predicted negative regulator of RcsB-dependent stress response